MNLRDTLRAARYPMALSCAPILFFAGCGRETADAVLIVDGEGVAVQGQVEIEFTPDGGTVPNIWVPGNVVIFRTAEEIRGQTGEAGMAYRITDDDELDPIGEVDLSKTDDELAEEFGVETAEPPAP
jgi:hypothetical protein